MNKILAIRFFVLATDQIPYDSYDIDWKQTGIGWAIYNWMEMHPEGKVDFLNL